MSIYQLKTERLNLRTLTETDAAVVLDVSKDEFATTEEVLDWMGWMKKMNAEGRLIIMFYIWLAETDQCVGRVYIHSKPELSGEVEIGYKMTEEHRNRGYMTEAAKAVVRFAFEEAGQDVLAAIVKPENIASRRVIEKLGFTRRGVRTVPDENGVSCEFDYFQFFREDLEFPPEEMSSFFAARAEGYDEHMLSGADWQYRLLGGCLPETLEPYRVLDIGCGTGIELDYIWQRMPNAHVTCVDLSREMLELLLKKHPDRHGQITVIEASYVDWAYPEGEFDLVVSNQTMHHFLPDAKTDIYCKILDALKSGGSYIEGDFMVDTALAEEYRARYERLTEGKAEAGKYHIDVPLTVEEQEGLLCDAGFGGVEVLVRDIRPEWCYAVIKATKTEE